MTKVERLSLIAAQSEAAKFGATVSLDCEHKHTRIVIALKGVIRWFPLPHKSHGLLDEMAKQQVRRLMREFAH